MAEGRGDGGKPDSCLGRAEKKRRIISGTMDVEEGATMDVEEGGTMDVEGSGGKNATERNNRH